MATLERLLSSRLDLIGRSQSKCDMFIYFDIYGAYKIGINCPYFFPLQLNLNAIASNRSHALTTPSHNMTISCPKNTQGCLWF
jgi:hypothetical protein